MSDSDCSPVLPASSSFDSTCFAPGPLKGPLVLHTEPRAPRQAYAPTPHPQHPSPWQSRATARPPHRHRSRQPPPSSGLSSTLACPELPQAGLGVPCILLSMLRGSSRGPRFLTRMGSCRIQGQGPGASAVGPPLTSGSSLFREDGGSWELRLGGLSARCPGPLILPLQPQPRTALTAQSCPAARLPSKPPGPLRWHLPAYFPEGSATHASGCEARRQAAARWAAAGSGKVQGRRRWPDRPASLPTGRRSERPAQPGQAAVLASGL